MTREEIWLKRRLGMITASELDNIVSASGKIIDGCLTYIRAKRFERIHGYSLPVTARPMEIGTETEPYIYEWLKANCMEGENPDSIVYSRNLPEIPFWLAEDCPFGASPDAYTDDERVIFEFKTLVGNESVQFYMDPYTSFEEKKARVWKDHGSQLLGLFISKPKARMVVVIKYAPMRDDIMADLDSPLAPWRGQRFLFERKNFEESIKDMKDRIRLFDAMIDSQINPSEFKVGEWSLVDGRLVQRMPEPKEKKK